MDLVEKVARAIAYREAVGEQAQAEAAIAIVLEEAAKVATELSIMLLDPEIISSVPAKNDKETMIHQWGPDITPFTMRDRAIDAARKQIAAAIRALGEAK